MTAISVAITNSVCQLLRRHHTAVRREQKTPDKTQFRCHEDDLPGGSKDSALVVTGKCRDNPFRTVNREGCTVPPRKKGRNWGAIRSTTTQSEFAQLIRRYPHRTSIVAEGDSWFAYPRKWLFAGKPNNIVNYLKNMQRFNLLHLACNGDEAVDMLSGKSKFRLLQSIHNHHVHYLLFSGGGNDIVGRWDFDYFLKSNVNSADIGNYLHKDRLNRRIIQIRHAYEDLIALCGAYSRNKQIKIVTHTYDYLIPSPVGAGFIGGLFRINRGSSWIYPYLADKRVPEKLHAPLVKYLINRLAGNLLRLQARHPERLVVADTRGVIDPETGWLNEIHPRPGGFKLLAAEIHRTMQAHPV